MTDTDPIVASWRIDVGVPCVGVRLIAAISAAGVMRLLALAFLGLRSAG